MYLSKLLYLLNLNSSLENNEKFKKYIINTEIIENIILSCYLLFNDYIDHKTIFVESQINKILADTSDVNLKGYDDYYFENLNLEQIAKKLNLYENKNNDKINEINSILNNINNTSKTPLYTYIIRDNNDYSKKYELVNTLGQLYPTVININNCDLKKMCNLNFKLMQEKISDNILLYFEKMNSMCNNFDDLDKFENSEFNKLNNAIIEIIKIYEVHFFVKLVARAIIEYFNNNYKIDSEKITSIVFSNYINKLTILFNTYMVKELGWENIALTYENTDVLKQSVIDYTFINLFNLTKNNDDVIFMNNILDFYMFIVKNVSQNIKEGLYEYINDNKKIYLLLNIENIINKSIKTV